MKLTLAEVKKFLDIQCEVPEGQVTGWSIDSRTVQPGDMFIAIKGEHVDGHKFVATAFEKGAIAALVSQPMSLPSAQLLFHIDDSVSGLGTLAAKARAEWAKPVIGVTGSAGKTGTKDIIATFLATRFTVGKNEGNFNNHIGLPLSILRLPAQADLAVLEMGMNHAGEIRYLAGIARPQVGVVTNVGYAHIEAFSSIEGIAAAKRELIESLPTDGVAVLNAEDARVLAFRTVHKGRSITYGMNNEADIRALEVNTTPEGSTFTINETRFSTSLPGRHAVLNILAGLAVASLFDIQPQDLVETVAGLAPAKMRGTRRFVRGIAILDDSYNSNPEAARSMLDILASEKAPRKIAVLGEMLELGNWTETMHRELGAYAAERGIDIVVGVQGAARFLVEEAQPRVEAFFFDKAESAGEFLREFVRSGDAVLFKGSRGAHIERALATMEG